MKAAEIITLARSELDDVEYGKTDQLWNTDELLGHLNEGEREACRRGGLLIDSDSRQRYTATVTYGSDGNVYRLVISGTTYSYTAVSGNTAAIVATALAALVNASLIVKASASAGVISIESRLPYGTYTIANTGTTTPGNLALANTTSVITQIQVTAGLFEYPIDPRVLYVRRARLGLGTTWLSHVTPANISSNPSTNTPTAWAIDENNVLQFNAIPAVDDRLYLSVIRLPKVDMGRNDSPEIPEHYHRQLTNWICYRALQKHDSETRNLESAQYYEANFTRDFGPAVSAQGEQAARRGMTMAVPMMPFGG